jgi:threonine aldolase
MDGARLWNACASRAITPAEYCRDVHTVAVCFAKGLGAPAGSVLAGGADVIKNARRFRKWYGGALHQSGILAAAALYGLHHHLDRLWEDHANARLLAERLSTVEGLRINVGSVETTIVLCDVRGLGVSASQFAEIARSLGVRISVWLPTVVRFVTHLGISHADIVRASERLIEAARVARAAGAANRL